MKKMILFLLMLALLAPAFALAESPPPGALVLEGQVSGALFLPDGRVVYVPVQKDGDNYLPEKEMRCVDAAGNLKWVCALPPGKLRWGGPQMLPDGGFGLVMAEGDGRQGVLHLISPEGKLLRSRKMPAGFRPLMLAGDRVYGTDEAFHLYAVDFDGKASSHQLPALGDQAAVLWTWPRDGGRFVLARGRLSGEEDFTKRRSDQALAFMDQAGAYTRCALLKDQSAAGGFASDAVLTPQGGITALAKNDDQANRDNEFTLIRFDEKGEQIWRRAYALGALTCRASLLDLNPDGSHTVWGMGKMEELDSSGFVFRLDVDQEGKPLALDARRCPGGTVVRYLEGRPYVHYPWGPKWWAAPFEALPEMEVKLQ